MAIVPAITMLAPHESPTSFTCPICHKEITGKSDILHRYCPVCRAFTTKCSIWACPQEPFIVVGNVVLCKPHGLEVGVVSA